MDWSTNLETLKEANQVDGKKNWIKISRLGEAVEIDVKYNSVV